MIERIFWRHAQTDWGKSDLARRLNDVGQRQAQQSADWLYKHGANFPVFCSQALRGQETAACYQAKPMVLSRLNPGQPVSAILALLDELGDRDAVIVGHLPWIGGTVATLLGQPEYVPFAYSEIFWLVSADGKTWRRAAHYNG